MNCFTHISVDKGTRNCVFCPVWGFSEFRYMVVCVCWRARYESFQFILSLPPPFISNFAWLLRDILLRQSTGRTRWTLKMVFGGHKNWMQAIFSGIFHSQSYSLAIKKSILRKPETWMRLMRRTPLNVTGIFLGTTKFFKIYWLKSTKTSFTWFFFQNWYTWFKKEVKAYFVKTFYEIFMVISTSC